MPRTRQSFESGHHRKFLVVIDETSECDRAVYYASRRAVRTGGKLVMLAVISMGEASQQWLGVGELMRAEARDEVEKRLDHYATRARHLAGIDPERVIREGNKTEEIQKLIEEDSDIGVLVLAAGTENQGPGPLVSSLASSRSVTMAIPITIVPGQLTDEELDALA
jgi:nucleotide-binding universal stress UspA family protein